MAHSLFSVFGVEIEYMVVRCDSLKVWPQVDTLITALGGNPDTHPVEGVVEADNELAAHVVEFKFRGPQLTLAKGWQSFQAMVQRCNATLHPMGAQLLPGGMHPSMDPARESKLWPHEDSPIYAAYDRIFNCKGHGWFNLQSVHLNLPFDGDAEFSALHNAISLLLPLLPALSASSPFVEGQDCGWLDGRLLQYAGNQRKLPSIIGPIVPEPVRSETEYREKILAPMWREIAPFDVDGLLQEEWLNSRAAIARFDRGAIEIRCLDTQECPQADLALCWVSTLVLKHLMRQGRDLWKVHLAIPGGALRDLFLESAKQGRKAMLPESYPWEVLGIQEKPPTLEALWRALLPLACASESTQPEGLKLDGEAEYRPIIEFMIAEGCLAERIRDAIHKGLSLNQVMKRLAESLETGALFRASV